MAIDNPDNWGYYSELNINNPSPDYQMRLVLKRGTGTNDPTKGIIYDGGNCSYDDMRDVRVGTDSDPATAEQLPQWAESVDPGIERIIWVKTNGNQTLYLFIGNSDASEYSDAPNTWIFLDSFETDTTGSYYSHKGSDSKSHQVYKEGWYASDNLRVITKTRITDYKAGTWGSLLGFAMADAVNSLGYTSYYVEGAINNDSDYGASNSPTKLILYAGSKTSNGSSTQKKVASFSLNTKYYFECCFSSSLVKTVYRDANYSQIDSIENTTTPSFSNLKYIFIYFWHCNEYGSTYDFSWNSSEKAVRMYVKRDNTFSMIDTLNDFIAFGKFALTEPAWGSFGDWQELAPPPPPPPPPSGGLSDINATPARVITTDFPAAAGLPKDKKVRIYAKAVSGQEKEILLDALA